MFLTVLLYIIISSKWPLLELVTIWTRFIRFPILFHPSECGCGSCSVFCFSVLLEHHVFQFETIPIRKNTVVEHKYVTLAVQRNRWARNVFEKTTKPITSRIQVAADSIKMIFNDISFFRG